MLSCVMIYMSVLCACRVKDARITLKTIHKSQLLLGSSKIKLGEVYLSGIDGLQGQKVKL